MSSPRGSRVLCRADQSASASSHTSSGQQITTTYGPDEVDAIAAYCEELDECYLIPIELVARRRGIQLRSSPPQERTTRRSRLDGRLSARWGCSSAGQSAWVAPRRSGVRVPSAPLNPNPWRGRSRDRRAQVPLDQEAYAVVASALTSQRSTEARVPRVSDGSVGSGGRFTARGSR